MFYDKVQGKNVLKMLLYWLPSYFNFIYIYI